MTATDQEMLKQQTSVLYGLYESKSQTFRRSIIAVMVLMLAVFSLVFWPYTNFRGEEFKLENTLNSLKVELEASSSYAAEFAREAEYFQNAMIVFHEQHEPLKAGGPQRVQEVAKLYQAYGSGGHVSQLRNELGGELRQRLDNSHQLYSACLVGDAESWKKYDKAAGCGAAEFGLFVDHQYRLVNDYQGELSSQLYDLRRNSKALNSKITETGNSLTDIRSKIQEIASLQNIETSLGAIPLGVNDLVMIFPVLLAAGFYLYVSLLLEAQQLRSAFRVHSQRLDRGIFSDAYIALIAPLWVDPLRSASHRRPRFLILFLPAAVFLFSLLLLYSNGLLRGSFLDEVRLSGWVYYVAYLVCAGLFAAGARRIFGTVRL